MQPSSDCDPLKMNLLTLHQLSQPPERSSGVSEMTSGEGVSCAIALTESQPLHAPRTEPTDMSPPCSSAVTQRAGIL